VHQVGYLTEINARCTVNKTLKKIKKKTYNMLMIFICYRGIKIKFTVDSTELLQSAY
jgi:hypothetical protein